jgi:hypothetical protein
MAPLESGGSLSQVFPANGAPLSAKHSYAGHAERRPVRVPVYGIVSLGQAAHPIHRHGGLADGADG